MPYAVPTANDVGSEIRRGRVTLGFGPTDVPINEAARQIAVERSGILTRKGDKELQRITDFAATAYQTDFACISIISGDREVLLCRRCVPFWEAPRSESFCAVTIQRPGEPLIVGDVAHDPRFAEFKIVKGTPHVRFYAGMPLMCRDGYALGALCVADLKPRVGAEVDPTELMLLARQAEWSLWR
jgi:GAF domain-containing protein